MECIEREQIMLEKWVVIITGASAGMGYEAAKLFSSKDWLVFAGARTVAKIPAADNIVPLELDITDSVSIQGFIQAVLAQTDRIDVLINNAGYGENGPIEEISMGNIRKQFETNFFGAVELTQLVLPIMRAAKNGRIINVASVGSNTFLPLAGYYTATKAALQIWSDTLDLEGAAFGIRSLIIQPGSTVSNWREISRGNARSNLNPNSVYQELTAKTDKALNNRPQTATSQDLARLFYKAATDSKPKLRYFNNFADHSMVFVARTFPTLWRNIVQRILRKTL